MKPIDNPHDTNRLLPTRRAFLSTAAAAAAVSIVPRHVLGGPGQTPPSERVNVAGVGIGGMGHNNLAHCAALSNIVALCDVDASYAAKDLRPLSAGQAVHRFPRHAGPPAGHRRGDDCHTGS